MVKVILLAVTLLSGYLNCYSQSLIRNKTPYIAINAGTFFATQTKIESDETGKLLETFNSPGVSFGLSYIVEDPHLFYSGSLAARILPTGYKLLIRNKDLTGTPDQIGTFDVLFRQSEYFFSVLSIPVRIGYQTLENDAKQKFWVNTGIETNFISPAGLILGSSRSHINLETESIAKVYPTFILGGGISKVHKNGDQLKFGLEYNISNTNILYGNYTVNLKNSSVNGTYRDTGTYIGFNFAYVFKLNK